jgi:hypothetical protein
VAIESLTLAVELFNRPNPTARAAGVLLPLQHGLEMLFKSVIYEKRGTIRQKGEQHSLKFSKCLGILRSDLGLLDEREALIAEMVDAHRDALQHYGSVITHQQLYVDAMGALTVFDDLHHRAFNGRLGDLPEFSELPLALTSKPPRSLHALVSSDFGEIKKLLAPRRRARTEAAELLRPHVLTDRAAQHPQAVQQPTDLELERMLDEIKAGRSWQKLLPGLADLALDHDDSVSFGLHIISRSKAPDGAIPARLVREGEPGAEEAVVYQERDRLKRFPFNQKALIERTDGANQEQVRAVIYLLKVKDDPKLYTEGTIGKVPFAQYSHEALAAVRRAVEDGRIPEAVAAYRQRPTARKPRGS